MKRSGWEVVIGLEIHVQLLTQSKIFSGSSTRFGAAPNTQASAIDLGLPGVLPMVNEAVYRKAVTFGLAIDAKINHRSVFDRKNYFYPDLPKGYQITQLNYPIVEAGKIHITLPDGNIKPIAITRAHLEEDAGKSLHTGVHGQTGIDLNRAGIPLLEIVSEPDMRSSGEAVTYAKIIHQLVTYLGISDGEMSQGSLRCDINVSVRPLGQVTLGTRTETKNVNSFRYMKSAIEFEIDRQITLLEAGGSIKQETRLYDSDKDETRPMRDKETSTDYRYFPEPDLLPVVIDDAYIEAIRATLPELPQQKIHRFISQYGITAADAKILATSRQLADYFESVVTIGGDARLAANWVRGDLLGQLHKAGLSISQTPVAAAELGYVMRKISDASISGKIAKKVFAALWQGEATTAASYIEQQGLIQVSGSALTPLVDEVIAANPKQVEQYRAGKTKLMGFFVGQTMQLIQGKANPKQLNELLQKKLNE